ncbi:hypothetical protein [Bradyrhizobium sp. BR2003]|uniref:hypothetical protein n=1 Tax=Bradyrhizobium sp. BR2003 TaxID=1419258 RepID=UPI0032DF2819
MRLELGDDKPGAVENLRWINALRAKLGRDGRDRMRREYPLCEAGEHSTRRLGCVRLLPSHSGRMSLAFRVFLPHE